MQWIPKLLLWMMLILSCLGTASSLIKPATDQSAIIHQATVEQQMAVSTVTSFVREWMTWSGEELPGDRLNRLKPYVNPTAMGRIGQLKAEQKTSRQNVFSVEFESLSIRRVHAYSVRVRVVVLNPARTIWEVEVPVTVQGGKQAAVTASPVIRPLQELAALAEPKLSESVVSSEVKQRMQPAIESFLKAMCEGKDTESLLNYISTGSKLEPLAGRIRFLSLDQLEATGIGPFTARATFTVQDAATGMSFLQSWELKVTEENQKFFVSAVASMQ
ncbi:conjugal transfer protein [Cohnella boryungensis]|uniref:Conjugal transfer protein n=1 Tax=Cohnella boryungensis TaxID=768479 RepID=A0ABV8SHF4_9BACL